MGHSKIHGSEHAHNGNDPVEITHIHGYPVIKPDSTNYGDHLIFDDGEWRCEPEIDQDPIQVCQVYRSSGQSSQNLNASPAVAVLFGSETVRDSIYICPNNTQVKVSQGGLYEVSYSISGSNTSIMASKNVFTWVRKNGSDIIYPSGSAGYALNSTNKYSTCTGTFVVFLVANDYIQVMSERGGSTGDSYAI
jgi:hypothetical protein